MRIINLFLILKNQKIEQQHPSVFFLLDLSFLIGRGLT